MLWLHLALLLVNGFLVDHWTSLAANFTAGPSNAFRLNVTATSYDAINIRWYSEDAVTKDDVIVRILWYKHEDKVYVNELNKTQIPPADEAGWHSFLISQLQEQRTYNVCVQIEQQYKCSLTTTPEYLQIHTSTITGVVILLVYFLVLFCMAIVHYYMDRRQRSLAVLPPPPATMPAVEIGSEAHRNETRVRLNNIKWIGTGRRKRVDESRPSISKQSPAQQLNEYPTASDTINYAYEPDMHRVSTPATFVPTAARGHHHQNLSLHYRPFDYERTTVARSGDDVFAIDTNAPFYSSYQHQFHTTPSYYYGQPFDSYDRVDVARQHPVINFRQ